MNTCQQIAVYILIADAIMGVGFALVCMIHDLYVFRNVKGWEK